MSENKRPNIDARYIAERRTVDVIDVLRRISDENHPVTKREILEEVETTDNPQTLSNTVDEILLQMNPIEYTGVNDYEYRIKYDGYDKPFDENPLIIKSEILEIKKALRRRDADKEEINRRLEEFHDGKAPSVTNIRYVHAFSDKQMDQLISAVALSASIAPNDKNELIKSIMDTASMYYTSPFYDKVNRKLRFDSYSQYSRLYSKDGLHEERLAENIRILQDAMRLRTKVQFHFDVYNEDKEIVSDDDEHIVSPYYIVVYHDEYYMIGAWDNRKEACHYRIDLMSGLEILREEDGTPTPMKAMSLCEGLPQRGSEWDPAKYMSEHLYMAYDKPRKISIRISEKWVGRYTTLHDWFGDYFRKNKSATAKCSEGYEVVDVVTSPNMIVHWAMQYGDKVEILNEDIREKICEEIDKMRRMYEI